MVELVVHNISDFGHQTIDEVVTYELQMENPILFEIKTSVFSGLRYIIFDKSALIDPYEHLSKFNDICSFLMPTNISRSSKRLRLLPISLTQRAKDWMKALPSKTISAWMELEQLFFGRFYSINNFVDLMVNIIRF